MKQLLLFIAALVVSVASFGQNLILNGDFENWDDDTKPTNWTTAQSITKESTIVHGGNYSAKHTGGTKNLGQEIAVEAGKTYVFSVWYYVEPGDGKDARIWCTLANSEGQKDYNNTPEAIRGGSPSGYLDNGNGNEWLNYTATVKIPDGLTQLFYELRTYSGAIVYYDDLSVTEYVVDENTVLAPSFSVSGGKYAVAQSITLSSDTEGATIHYTTDGTEATAASPQYSGAIEVSSTTTISAIAVKDGMTNSDVVSATYSFPVVCTSVAQFLALENGTLATISGQVVSVEQGNGSTLKALTIKDASGAELYVYGVYNVSEIVYVVGQTLSITGDRDLYQTTDELTFGTGAAYSIVIVSEGTPTTVETAEMVQVKFYPNPFANHLSIKADAEIASVSIVNTLGQVVQQITPGASEASVPTAHLASGVYLVKVVFEDGSSRITKVMKQ